MSHEEMLEKMSQLSELTTDWTIELETALAECETEDERLQTHSQFIRDNAERYREIAGLKKELRLFDVLHADSEHSRLVAAVEHFAAEHQRANDIAEAIEEDAVEVVDKP